MRAGRDTQEKRCWGRRRKEPYPERFAFEGEKGLQPPQRNIFSPRRTGLSQSESKGAGIPQGLQKNPGTVGPEPSRASLSLSYIGYIVSGEKIIALIVLEGDILYVEKGDIVGEGIRIGEITASEIEVIGPGSEKKKYLIQGDSE